MPKTKNAGIRITPARMGRTVARDEVGAIRAEHHKRRMRHVRHVEQAEGHRQPDADRGIEAAEQDPNRIASNSRSNEKITRGQDPFTEKRARLRPRA